MKAVTHIHTRRSWDSRTSPSALAAALVEFGVELAVVADHNDFRGAIEFAEHCTATGADITVPVAAEIRTDEGDALVILEPGREPPPVDALLRWDDLVPMVRELGGLVGLPHPYRGHADPERIAADADFIEVFNARCTDAEDALASDLCERTGSFRSFGADAHRPHEIGRVVVEYDPMPSAVATLRQHARCATPVRTPRSDWMAAEVINGIKRRRPLVAGYYAAQFARHRVRELRRTW